MAIFIGSRRRVAGRLAPLNLGPLETFIGFFIRRAQLAVYADFLRDAPVALTPGQLGILLVIEHNQSMMQQDLCNGVGLDKSTFTLLLDGLAARNLVRRVRSKEDRRKNTLRLTPRGKKALATMLKHVDRHERRLFAPLSTGERTELMRLLKKVVAARGPAQRR
jgi:DNA-binding MarR family transcriptional regulator